MGGSEHFLQGLKSASPTHCVVCRKYFVNVTDGVEVVVMWNTYESVLKELN